MSAKRHITHPIDQCKEAGMGPGDEYRSFVAAGRITIVRQGAGAARGMLRHVTVRARTSTISVFTIPPG